MQFQYFHKRKSWQELLQIYPEAMMTPLKIEKRKYMGLIREKNITDY